MSDRGLSPKEMALLRSAREEAAALKTARPRRSSTARPAAPAPGPTTLLDQATVMGWDHPAAAAAAPKVKIAAEEKWERLALIMEAEREAAREQRARLKRNGGFVLLGVCVLMLFWVLRVLSR